jgi:hypothetical protein
LKRDQIYDAPKLSYLKINKSTDEAEITSDFPPGALANSQSKNKGEAHQDKKERTHLNLYCGAFEGIVQHWQHFSANIVSRGFL